MEKGKEKRRTKKEALTDLEEIIGSPAPVMEAESLKRQIALIGSEDAEISPELDEAVSILKKRTEENKQRQTHEHERKK